jgi:NAD(P)-dependent dehydrogenase (short-subunit alcohol dehydrogenase family)
LSINLVVGIIGVSTLGATRTEKNCFVQQQKSPSLFSVSSCPVKINCDLWTRERTMTATSARRLLPVLLAFMPGLVMMTTSALATPSPFGAILITGSTDGIGLTTAKNMALKGYDVLIHGRDEERIEKAKEAVEKFKREGGIDARKEGRIVALPPVDIASIAGCKQLVGEVQKACREEGLSLKVLLNNAGVFVEKHTLREGLELTFATNVLAPFVITSMLLPLLLQTQRSRIVIASSISQTQVIREWDDMHYKTRPYDAHVAYGESNLLAAMLCMELSDRLLKKGIETYQVTCNCLDPGTVNTKLLLAGWGPCGIDVSAALDETWICSSKDVGNTTGKYFVYRTEHGSTKTYKQSDRDKMWRLLSGLAPEMAKVWN